eukprot:366028-Chlamydomonas_euryale.AAC.40
MVSGKLRGPHVAPQQDVRSSTRPRTLRAAASKSPAAIAVRARYRRMSAPRLGGAGGTCPCCTSKRRAASMVEERHLDTLGRTSAGGRRGIPAAGVPCRAPGPASVVLCGSQVSQRKESWSPGHTLSSAVKVADACLTCCCCNCMSSRRTHTCSAAPSSKTSREARSGLSKSVASAKRLASYKTTAYTHNSSIGDHA